MLFVMFGLEEQGSFDPPPCVRKWRGMTQARQRSSIKGSRVRTEMFSKRWRGQAGRAKQRPTWSVHGMFLGRANFVPNAAYRGQDHDKLSFGRAMGADEPLIRCKTVPSADLWRASTARVTIE